MSKQLINFKTTLKTILIVNARESLKDEKVKSFVDDIRYHFKTDGWHLSYSSYSSMYPGRHSTFDVLLCEILKLKIKYDSFSGSLVITRGTKK